MCRLNSLSLLAKPISRNINPSEDVSYDASYLGGKLGMESVKEYIINMLVTPQKDTNALSPHWKANNAQVKNSLRRAGFEIKQENGQAEFVEYQASMGFTNKRLTIYLLVFVVTLLLIWLLFKFNRESKRTN